MSSNEIGARLKSIRGALSQREFADRLSTSSGRISELEGGKTTPGGDFLLRLHQEFDTDVTWLLTGMQLTGARREEAAFIGMDMASRAAHDDQPIPPTTAFESLAAEERQREAKLVAVRALLTNMPRPAFNDCTQLVTSFSRLEPQDQAALVRHGLSLEHFTSRKTK